MVIYIMEKKLWGFCFFSSWAIQYLNRALGTSLFLSAAIDFIFWKLFLITFFVSAINRDPPSSVCYFFFSS